MCPDDELARSDVIAFAVGNARDVAAPFLTLVLRDEDEQRRGCPGDEKDERAHPDLNQGPADLQSAALTTELCTQMMSWPEALILAS